MREIIVLVIGGVLLSGMAAGWAGVFRRCRRRGDRCRLVSRLEVVRPAEAGTRGTSRRDWSTQEPRSLNRRNRSNYKGIGDDGHRTTVESD